MTHFDVDNWSTFEGLHAEKPLNYVLGETTDIFGHRIGSFDDVGFKNLDRFTPKWCDSDKHEVQRHSEGPDIHGGTAVIWVPEELRCRIRGRSAKSCEMGVFLVFAWETEIGEFYPSRLREDNIFSFDISMNDAFGVLKFITKLMEILQYSLGMLVYCFDISDNYFVLFGSVFNFS